MLKRLTVDNYRSLERVQVALHPFTAFVGANGTGKSSVLRAIDLVLGQRYPNVSSSAFQQNYVAGGSVTGATRLEDPSVVTQWFFLTGVSVRAARPADAVVALGDSITDGGELDRRCESPLSRLPGCAVPSHAGSGAPWRAQQGDQR